MGETQTDPELIAVGLSTSDDYPIRLAITLDKTLAMTPRSQPSPTPWTGYRSRSCGSTASRIGGQLAEQTERRPRYGRIPQRRSPRRVRELWATTAKLVDAAGPDQLPPNRDLAYQIHSIRKMISASRQNVFDVDANEQHPRG